MTQTFSEPNHFVFLSTKASIMAGLITPGLGTNTESKEKGVVITSPNTGTEHIGEGTPNLESDIGSKRYISEVGAASSASFGFEDQTVVAPTDEWGIVDELEELRSLEEGWDGYGAPSIPDEVIALAKSAATRPEVFEKAPEVFPTGRRSVQFEFDTPKGGQAELEIFDQHHTNLLINTSTGEVFYEEEASLDQSISLLDDLLT